MMKTLGKTYIFLLITAIFTACTEHGNFERRLAVADSLMTHEMPDSAYRMLCGMDAEAEEVSEPLRMRHLLLRSNAQNKAYVDFTSDSICCLLVDYYDAHGTSNERMLAHYIKGCAYRDMGDQPASLRCYNDAVAAADTSVNNLFIIRALYGRDAAEAAFKRYLNSGLNELDSLILKNYKSYVYSTENPLDLIYE